MNYGITFNDKHSYDDLGLIMEYFKPQPPVPKKIIEPVVFMNGDGYDFSTVGSNGEVVYNDRDIPCRFNYFQKSKEDVESKYMEVCEWLLGTGKISLIADVMSDVEFIAEVQDPPSYDKFERKGTLDIIFRAEPFRYLLNNFVITITKAQNIYNPYIYCNPSIRVYGAGNFILNGESISVSGTYTDINYLILKNGNNSLSFDGSITKVEITPNWRRLG